MCPIPLTDRIINKSAPISLTDKSLLNALNLMLILDNIVDGAYTLKLPTWTYATRTLTPVAGQIGLNTDGPQIECYNGQEWITLG